MAMRIYKTALVGVIFAGLLSNPPALSSCGPFVPTAAFTFWKIPEDAAGRFARGELGIIQPRFPRFYLIIAYRYLAGFGLNAEEREALFGPQPATQNPFSSQVSEGLGQWEKARDRVTGSGTSHGITPYKTITGDNYYIAFVNCNDDAFANAAKTLEDRIRSASVQSPAVKDWVAAQDQVFTNCSGGPAIPASLGSDATPLAQADRAYQIAAANFYAGTLDVAEQMFRAIGDNRGSPWSAGAPYLVARALVRKATLGVKGQGVDREKLTAAEAYLQSILNDPARSAVHPAARRLLDYVRVRLHPAERVRELARALVQQNAQATILQNSTDYRYLYDEFEEGRFGGWQALPADDELTSWIGSFQHDAPDAANKAAAEWRAKQTPPWLVAALATAGSGQPGTDDMIAAARKIKQDSPAYATATFHAIRLLIDSKHVTEAREWLDHVLAADAATLPTSSVNMFRAERMNVAANWDEFLKYAVRIPAGTFTGFQQYGNADIDGEDASYPEGVTPRQAAFDADAGKILNEQIPLEMLLDAARRDTLSKHLRREIAATGWVRSVLLGDEGAAKNLATLLQELEPDLKAPLQTYLNASDAESRNFAAVFLMLRFPGMRPYVQAGFGRLTPTGKLDELRDNWWCPFKPVPDSPPDYYRVSSVLGAPLLVLYPDGAPKAQFLTPEQRSRGESEWSRLTAMPAAPEYLGAQTVAWVGSHPSDPRAAEALHLAVRAVRYGCGARAGASKAAFQLLHSRYPNSEWARKTKYWY
jgi:hypothetical protein